MIGSSDGSISYVTEFGFSVLGTQRARKLKKVQAKKLVKTNKPIFFREIAFLAVLAVLAVQK